MLNFVDLNQYYGGSHILRGVALEAQLGEITVILGRNGVGKTTLLKSLGIESGQHMSKAPGASVELGALLAAIFGIGMADLQQTRNRDPAILHCREMTWDPLCCRFRGAVGKEKGRLKSLSSQKAA